MGVDGFRFDLATTLARGAHGYYERAPFLQAVRQDPVLARVKLIVEPWDLGPGGYQLGNFPPGCAEWNDRFRDTVRRFWRGDEGQIGELASRITGSADLFHRRGRRPWASINFVTAHDGLTLRDLVSYNEKHNEANGENNRDGIAENISWNCGAEGESDDEDVLRLRERQQRNLLVTLLLSMGVPMLVAGDEIGNSARGNNNPYCQDNETGWITWPAPGAAPEWNLFEFVRTLIAFRKKYKWPHGGAFLKGEPVRHGKPNDVSWIKPDGTAMTESDWNAPQTRFLALILGGDLTRRFGLIDAEVENDAPVVLALNGHDDDVPFTVPSMPSVRSWVPAFDTAAQDGRPPKKWMRGGEHTIVTGRSVLVMVGMAHSGTSDY
jgi:glycogen operon protein